MNSKLIVKFEPFNNKVAISDGNSLEYGKSKVLEYLEDTERWKLSKYEMVLTISNWIIIQVIRNEIAKGNLVNTEVEFWHEDECYQVAPNGDDIRDETTLKPKVPDWWGPNHYEELLWEMI